MIKERQSNFELLRIISMFMILLLHANFSAFGWPEGDSTTALLRILAESIAIIAPNLFVLITGFFGVTLKLSKIVNLLFQIVFTVFSVTLLLILFNIYQFNSWKELAHGFYFWNYWFLNAYIVLLLLSPLSNLAIEYLNQSSLKYLLILLFIVFCIIDGDFFISPMGIGVNSGYSVIWFLYLYLLGRYIAKYPIRISFLKLLFLYLFSLLGAFILIWKRHDYGYNSPFILIESVVVFLMFQFVDFSSKTVNFIASSSLMVFLLHGHPVLFRYYKGTLELLNEKYGNGLEFVLFVLLFCVGVYTIAVIYDQVRELIWKQIEPRVRKWDCLLTVNE